jgi:hypothetical protein
MDVARRQNAPPGNVFSIRCSELFRLFSGRYGHYLPDDDAGRDEARIYLAHSVKLSDGTRRANNFLELWCPWMEPAERDLFIGDAILGWFSFDADDVGARLNLSPEERQRYAITTIGAVGIDRDARLALRRQKRALAAKERRLKSKLERERDRAEASAKVKLGPVDLAVRRAVSRRWVSAVEITKMLAPAFPDLEVRSLARAVNRSCVKLVSLGEFEERPVITRQQLRAREVRMKPPR